ncbi:hypothetical protein IF1G_00604 [Cordyceps javanica]|uniref:Uncharacterized protein n=1 Tax=Cordyceps javanica TaxID=43265 RepID=A0A545VG24_9HYPO|nr:hypothetical protein IF1G_00604 [Cordyceps javanica]
MAMGSLTSSMGRSHPEGWMTGLNINLFFPHEHHALGTPKRCLGWGPPAASLGHSEVSLTASITGMGALVCAGATMYLVEHESSCNVEWCNAMLMADGLERPGNFCACPGQTS